MGAECASVANDRPPIVEGSSERPLRDGIEAGPRGGGEHRTAGEDEELTANCSSTQAGRRWRKRSGCFDVQSSPGWRLLTGVHVKAQVVRVVTSGQNFQLRTVACEHRSASHRRSTTRRRRQIGCVPQTCAGVDGTRHGIEVVVGQGHDNGGGAVRTGDDGTTSHKTWDREGPTRPKPKGRVVVSELDHIAKHGNSGHVMLARGWLTARHWVGHDVRTTRQRRDVNGLPGLRGAVGVDEGNDMASSGSAED